MAFLAVAAVLACAGSAQAQSVPDVSALLQQLQAQQQQIAQLTNQLKTLQTTVGGLTGNVKKLLPLTTIVSQLQKVSPPSRGAGRGREEACSAEAGRGRMPCRPTLPAVLCSGSQPPCAGSRACLCGGVAALKRPGNPAALPGARSLHTVPAEHAAPRSPAAGPHPAVRLVWPGPPGLHLFQADPPDLHRWQADPGTLQTYGLLRGHPASWQLAVRHSSLSPPSAASRCLRRGLLSKACDRQFSMKPAAQGGASCCSAAWLPPAPAPAGRGSWRRSNRASFGPTAAAALALRRCPPC